MPVSYVSDVIRSNPLIQPFDLNLMAKVNSYKQSLFYQNAAKTENMITQLNNSDIANPEQRAYLKNKVNNLTTQLNNTGAINYSDMNIANTIEGFGSDIYNDKNVMNGIVSTKYMREWQSNVQKLKTDPKLSKYYSGANEAWDMDHYIKPYVSGGIDATYEGPRAPKPYKGNPFSIAMEALKNIRPDIEQRIDPVTGNQFFFSKTENKQVSSEDIAATLDGIIDGDTKQQLKIDAWYNYDYSTGYKFGKPEALDVYTQDFDNVLANRNSELDSINSQIKSEPDVNKLAALNQRKAKIQDDIKTYGDQRGKMINDFSKDYDKDPENAKYRLYMKRFYNDLVKAAGYDETKISLVKDEQRLFTARQQLEYTKAGLFWDGQSYNADGTPHVQLVDNAEHMGKTGKTGKDGKPVVDVAAGMFHDLTLNTETNEEAKKHQVTETTLQTDNQTITAQQTKDLRSFLEKTAKRGNYDLGFTDHPESNPGAAAVTSNSPLLEAIQSFGDKSVLDKGDIQQFLKNFQANNGQVYNAGKIHYNGKDLAVTKEQLQFFRNVMKNWDAVATGQLKSDEAPMNISVSDLSQFTNDYQLKELVKKSNVAYIANVKAQALEGTGLTPAQADRYKYYLDNPNAQGTVKMRWNAVEKINEPQFTENPEWTNLKNTSKVSGSTVKQRISDAFANASNRENYYSLYLPTAEVLEKQSPGLMAKLRNDAVNNHAAEKELKPGSITRKPDGSFEVSYTYEGAKGVPGHGAVTMAADEAIRLGGQIYPNEPLERLLTYQTSSGPMYTYSTAFKQPIKYSIEREGNDRNQHNFLPYIYYIDQKTGKEAKTPIFATDKQGFQGSANAAEQLLTQYITNLPQGTTIEQFIAGAQALRNR